MSLHATFAFTFDINPSSSKFHFSFQQICKKCEKYSGCHTNKQTSWKSLRMFFSVGPQHSGWWKGDHQITTHHTTHQITSRKRIAAFVQQFWGGSVLGYQWDNLAFFLNGLEYHQPFFTFFAATLKCIEKRPNLAVLWSHRIYNAWNIISGKHCRCLLGIQGALRDLEPVVDLWSHCLVVHYHCSTIFNK